MSLCPDLAGLQVGQAQNFLNAPWTTPAGYNHSNCKQTKTDCHHSWGPEEALVPANCPLLPRSAAHQQQVYCWLTACTEAMAPTSQPQRQHI